jgi:hypothetical protein
MHDFLTLSLDKQTEHVRQLYNEIRSLTFPRRALLTVVD